MSNETKRDVFDDALAYAPVGREYDPVNDDEAGDLRSCLSARYDAALPDDLPVIPRKIGNFIKQSVYEDATLQEALECAHDKQFGVGRWISAHSEIFARAWILGVWRVEETGEIVKLEAEK
ncbi:hypothetical protein [Lacticaseibacillus paracasei]|uniref:Uncharacterized protein n=1 Tax=Lacticaseibacillus paracasei NRIC 0644 TaxID=1435038 RepID=A0A0C9NUS2_LACPA|nr:hypothetical protein [Lacticaseibacillus paracasei]GAN35655.1 hypothetical protein LC0644_0244 [Lacticaseibacillus paracasei NRIC 0644]GAN38886.1 hypothetical protein LC1917_0763 [Lacticaseibacillus paracasei NRIC 1917]